MSETRPLVVKIGGGLLRTEGVDGLRRACAEVNEIATDRPVLVVPGGGPFADAVRAVDEQVGLADELAHWLALRGMDQFGAVLAQWLPSAEPLLDLVAPRAIGLLAVAPAFGGRPGVPESWTVTSDSLAVLAAGAIGADEAVLLKPQGGVPGFSTLPADELRALQDAGEGSFVDAYLPDAVCRTGVTVLVRTPGQRCGTRITPR